MRRQPLGYSASNYQYYVSRLIVRCDSTSTVPLKGSLFAIVKIVATSFGIISNRGFGHLWGEYIRGHPNSQESLERRSVRQDYFQLTSRLIYHTVHENSSSPCSRNRGETSDQETKEQAHQRVHNSGYQDLPIR